MALKSYPGTLRNAVADSVNYVDGTFNVRSADNTINTCLFDHAVCYILQEVLFITDGGLNTVLDRVMSDLQSKLDTCTHG